MLILSRRVSEIVNIGEDITITVLGIVGNQVRLGITAPRHVAVNRQEIHERMEREHGAAVSLAIPRVPCDHST